LLVLDPLFHITRIHPHKLALSFEGQTWTYAQMEVQVQTFINLLISLGIKQDIRIGILSQNSAEQLFCVLAIARLQAISVLLNTRLSALEIINQLKVSETHWLIHDQTNFDLAQEVSQKISVNLTQIPLTLPNSNPLLHNSHFDLNRIQAILFTSGTSGQPKPISLSFQNHFSSAIAVKSCLAEAAENLSPNLSENLSLCCLPLFHVGGLAMIWRSLIWGTGLILLRSFNPKEIHNSIVKVNNISLVPTMLQRLLNDPDFRLADWQRLDYILLGGESAKAELIQTCLKLKIPIAPTYGMTEAASQIATLNPAELSAKPNSVGKPLACNTLKILGENAKELNPMEVGEIIVCGKNIYLGEAEWLHTGDLGYLDAEHYLYILQRRTDLIISGGENIYPSQIEALLINHPAISEVCVVGKSDPIWGQSVAVVFVSDRLLTLEEIQNFCLAQGLAKYKLPKYVDQISELPKTASGKIQRQLVKEMLTEHKS